MLKADGTENTGAVGTGNKIAVYANGTLVKQYDVVIYGDINGDGKISVVDLVMMQKQILGTSQLSGAYAAAADISRDGKVSVKDLVNLQKNLKIAIKRHDRLNSNRAVWIERVILVRKYNFHT